MLRQFLFDPLINPFRGVPLFPRRLPVVLQDLVDERLHRLDPRLLADPLLALWWDRPRQRLAHPPPVYPILPREARDRFPFGVLSPKLLKHLHLGSPFHPQSLPNQASEGYRRWAKSDEQCGPNVVSKLISEQQGHNLVFQLGIPSTARLHERLAFFGRTLQRLLKDGSYLLQAIWRHPHVFHPLTFQAQPRAERYHCRPGSSRRYNWEALTLLPENSAWRLIRKR